MLNTINIKTATREEIIDITAKVQRFISDQKVDSGIIVIYSPHTTAAITVNENADPDVKADITSFLNKTIPQYHNFKHLEGNSDAHLKGSLMGFSQTFIIEKGKLLLGTWQGIYFMEFDGPRDRKLFLKLVV